MPKSDYSKLKKELRKEYDKRYGKKWDWKTQFGWT
jgi:hypothetical protein